MYAFDGSPPRRARLPRPAGKIRIGPMPVALGFVFLVLVATYFLCRYVANDPDASTAPPHDPHPPASTPLPPPP